MEKNKEKLAMQNHKVLLRLLVSHNQQNVIILPLFSMLIISTFALAVYLIGSGEYLYSLPAILSFGLFFYNLRKYIKKVNLLKEETKNYLNYFEDCFSDFFDNEVTNLHNIINKQNRL